MKSISLIIILIFSNLINYSQTYFGTKIKLLDKTTKQIITDIDSIIIIDSYNKRTTIIKKDILVKNNVICISNLPRNKEFKFVFFCPKYQITSNYFLTTNIDKFINTLEITKPCDYKYSSDTIDIGDIPCLIDDNFDKKLIINSKEIITKINFLSSIDNFTYPQFSPPTFSLLYKYKKDEYKNIEKENPIYIEFARILKGKIIVDKDYKMGCKIGCGYVSSIYFSIK